MAKCLDTDINSPISMTFALTLASKGVRTVLLEKKNTLDPCSKAIPQNYTGDLPMGAGQVGAIFFAALTEDGHKIQSYIVTGPEKLSITKFTEKLSAFLGKPISYVDISPEDFKKSLLRHDVLKAFR